MSFVIEKLIVVIWVNVVFYVFGLVLCRVCLLVSMVGMLCKYVVIGYLVVGNVGILFYCVWGFDYWSLFL